MTSSWSTNGESTSGCKAMLWSLTSRVCNLHENENENENSISKLLMENNLSRVSLVHSISPGVRLALISFLVASTSTEWNSLVFPCDGTTHAEFDEGFEEALSVWPLSTERSAR